MPSQYRPYPWTKDLNYVWSIASLDWVAMTQPGGGGGGDATAANQVTGNASLASIDGKLPALVGGRVPVNLDEPIDVTVLGTVAVSGPATDAQQRANQTATGTISGNGQSVSMALNGAKSAAVRFASNSFVGSVRFYTSHNGGATYEQCQAIRPYPFDVINFRTPAWTGDTSTFTFCLVGGETHVRVTSTAYTSGNVDLAFVGTEAPTSGILNAMAITGDNNIPLGHVVVAGARNTGSYAISANTGSELLSDIGLVVRNVTAVQSDGNAAGGTAYRMLVAGADPDDNLVRTLQLDSTDPSGTEYGLIVRNIPSGTQTISGTVTANAGTNLNTSALNLEATQADVRTALQIIDDWDESDRAKVNPIAGQVGVQGGAGVSTALTQRVALATDANIVKETRSGTATTSQVADNAASVQLLAANTNRLGATIENDSSAALYLKLGTTASLTDYTVRMVQYSYYEVPFGYTGRIDGIWASDPGDGAARITELT